MRDTDKKFDPAPFLTRACTTAKAQVTIGPWIDNGFFYDFDMQGGAFEDKDLKAIKKEMIKIINKVCVFACIKCTSNIHALIHVGEDA
jgi:threonyl-tRNA synthetase